MKRMLLAFIIFLSCSNSRSTDHKTKVNFSRGISAEVVASSTLEDNKYNYSVLNLFDEDISTAWAEGSKWRGANEYIEIKFNKRISLNGLILYPGLLKTSEAFVNNCVPDEISIYLDDIFYKDYKLSYRTKRYEQINGRIIEQNIHINDEINQAQRIILFNKEVNVTKFKLFIKSSLAGLKYDDLCISELDFITNDFSGKLINNKIISLLTLIKNRKFDSLVTADNIEIDNLNIKDRKQKVDDYNLQFDRHEIDQYASQKIYCSKIENDPSFKNNKLYYNFFRFNNSAFIEHQLIYYSKENVVIAGISYINGGGSEWIESYPVIKLTNEYSIKSVKENSIYLGVPDPQGNNIPEVK